MTLMIASRCSVSRYLSTAAGRYPRLGIGPRYVVNQARSLARTRCVSATFHAEPSINILPHFHKYRLQYTWTYGNMQTQKRRLRYFSIELNRVAAQPAPASHSQ